jgi:hypothetical protein
MSISTAVSGAAAAADAAFFDLRGAMIESDQPQEAVDAFAADFQALRHFGLKMGAALNLGSPSAGILSETGHTLAYSNPDAAPMESLVVGSGIDAASRIPVSVALELLSHTGQSAS